MDDQTTPPFEAVDEVPSKTIGHIESHFFNISVRAWIALLVVGTVCFMSVSTIKVEEPLYTLVGMIVGYYYAQGTKPKTQGGNTQ